MKMQRVASLVGLAILCGIFVVSVRASRTKESSAASPDVKPYLGRWDLMLKAADKEYPSWLALREEGGQLKAEYVGRWGNVRER